MRANRGLTRIQFYVDQDRIRKLELLTTLNASQVVRLALDEMLIREQRKQKEQSK